MIVELLLEGGGAGVDRQLSHIIRHTLLLLLNKAAAILSKLVRWRVTHLQVGAGSAITKGRWLDRGVGGVGRVLVEYFYLLVVGGAASVH